jgi:uncharacterized protein
VPEYLAPGVYVEEVSFRSKSIEGVSTSTAAFVGPTLKGPLSLRPDQEGVVTPEVITSFGEFERVYGGLENLSFGAATDADPDQINYLAHAAKAFFDNGGRRLFVARAFTPRADDDDGRAATDPFAGEIANPDTQARFVARFPGSAGNVSVIVRLDSAPAARRTLQTAPEGSLLRTGALDPAGPARMSGARPPFHLSDGDHLLLDVSGAEVDVQIQGTPAEVVGAAVADPADLNLPADAALAVTVTGWPGAQTIPLTVGETLEEVAARLNTGLRLAHAEVRNDNELALLSDLSGLGVSITVSALAELGFNAETTDQGDGNVQRLDAVTLAEINGLLPANAPIRLSQDIDTGGIVITTTGVGEAATLQAQGNTARAFGLGNNPTTDTASPSAAGRAGEAITFLTKTGGAWLDENGVVGNTSVHPFLQTMSVLVRYPDGREVIFEELGLSLAHPRWAGNVLTQNPTRKAEALMNPIYLEVGPTLLANPDLPSILVEGLFVGLTENRFELIGGNDGARPDNASYQTGFALLSLIDDISIVAAPGFSADPDESAAQAIQNSIVTFVESRPRYRIAVLDTPSGLTPGEALDWRAQIDTTYAALYYPWVVIPNPNARPGNDRIPKEIILPPSGFIAGIYARSDNNRGVWKPPANETVLGALRFERDITFGQQELLNPRGVNCLRFFYGRGYRVWGARTVSSDPEWKYVNVRRYMMYLERSIDVSTQWAVFEPNGEALWANIRETVSSFLYNEWRSGALLGSKPEEAYFVRCDRSTMTQNDLDNGRLICLIGVAALKPAEFVIFRIGQKTADARA